METRIKGTKLTSSPEIHSIRIQGKQFSFDKPCVMGIININEDSFFAGSRVSDSNFLHLASRHVQEGAQFLDLGASSSRPGALISQVSEEWKRLQPVITAVRKEFPTSIISVDTYHAQVARWAVESGADLINDISAGKIDPAMFATVAELKAPYILMHMQGRPDSMQQNPVYKDVVYEVFHELHQTLQMLKQVGVEDVIVDPGFGFGKSLEHNYQLLNKLDVFHKLKIPLLVGVSRKSMLTRLLDVKVDDALNGSTVLHTIAIQKGAQILRVHDVKPAVEAIRILEMIRSVK